MSHGTTISPRELAALHEKKGQLDVIDVRTPVEYAELHLEFSRNVPLDQLDPKVVMQSRSVSRDEPLYVICRSGGRGEMACAKFHREGYDNLVNVEGGTAACERVGLPLVRGPKTLSLERQVRIAAGTLVLGGVVAGWLIHPAFMGLSAFVGAGLLFSGITNTCGMGLLLAKMPWNRCPNAKH